MEAILAQLLLTLGLAVLALLAFLLRRTTTEHSRGGTPSPTKKLTIVAVSDPAIVKLTLVDHADAFANRPAAIFPTGFSGRTHSINSVPHGPMWRALRCSLTSGIIHPTRLHQLAALQQEAAAAIVADLSARAAAAGGGEVVVVRDSLHASVFALSARLCFGDSGVGERQVRAIERELVQFVFTFLQDSALFAAGASWVTKLRHWRQWLRWSGVLTRVHKLVNPIIAARKQSRRNGGSNGGIRSYVDSLLDLQIPDSDSDNSGRKRRPLTDEEMVRLVFEFLSVNTVSAVACVECTLAHLVLDPEVQNKLHREITDSRIRQQDNGMVVSEEQLIHRRLPYLRAVMLESLRLHPPVPLMVRHVSAKDAAIIAGASTDSKPTIVKMNIRKIGRNKKVWTDPDEFRPERFLAGGEAEGVGPVPGPKEIRMVPFGAGLRQCPGVEIGMVRVGCILTALVSHFEWALLAADSDSLDLEVSGTFFAMMKTPLRARITPRTLLSTM